MNQSRGYVTVATGNELYYKMAANLLRSYRGRGAGRYPFAIICDRKNEYTELFDEVVVQQEYRGSTVDKLLMRFSPFQESIFLDADTLILENIDDLWGVFGESDDVSAFGRKLPLDAQDGWFTYEGSGRYKPLVKYLLSMNGGIYYFKKTERAEKVFDDALNVIKAYAEIDFKYFDTPQDEPLMAMAMVINGCKPCEVEYPMIVLPACERKVTVDRMGTVFEGKNQSVAKLIHFSAPRTKLFLYKYLNALNHHPKSWGTMINYLRIKLCMMTDLKFGIYHTAGALLRRRGLDEIVEKMKKYLH